MKEYGWLECEVLATLFLGVEKLVSFVSFDGRVTSFFIHKDADNIQDAEGDTPLVRVEILERDSVATLVWLPQEARCVEERVYWVWSCRLRTEPNEGVDEHIVEWCDHQSPQEIWDELEAFVSKLRG